MKCFGMIVVGFAMLLMVEVPVDAGDALRKLTKQKLSAIRESNVSLRTDWQEIPRSGPYHEYRANLHVHSHWSHDSRGQIEDIVEAAKKTDTRVLMFTEHPADHYDFFSEGHQGIRDGVLLIPGAEMNGFLVYPTMSLKGINVGTPQELSDLVRGRNGQLFVSHPEERMDWQIEGVSGIEIYNTHADFKEEKELISALKNPLRVYQLAGLIREFPQECYSALQDYPQEYLKKWDTLCLNAPHTGVAANDAHQNIGIAIRWLEADQARLEDALGEKLFDLNLSLVPGSKEMREGRQPGDILFQIQLDPYENALRHAGTHLLIEGELSEMSVRECLEAGRVFVGFDWIADSRGFDFHLESENESSPVRVEMGDRMPWKQGCKAMASAPLPVHWKLIRNGEIVAESEGRTFEKSVEADGVYRVEAWVDVDDEPMIWILSNPVRIDRQ